ncbi:MAG: SH3 domain-containing protein, partial [Treponema sp.]|nr:SH3 domain-containing protein [Treponema sp.]
EDIQSSILLQTAEALDPEKEKNRRQALLDSALYDYPESIFAGDIQALAGGDSEVPIRGTEAWFTVMYDDAIVHESPNTSSRIIAQLADTTEVRVTKETVHEFTIEGQTARWYYIAQPVEGWIFGDWLE